MLQLSSSYIATLHAPPRPQAEAFLEEPPKPNTARRTSKKKTKKMMLAVSPWRVPMPTSQYQCSPTLGGSPATAGMLLATGTATAPAVAATVARRFASERPGCTNAAGAEQQD